MAEEQPAPAQAPTQADGSLIAGDTPPAPQASPEAEAPGSILGQSDQTAKPDTPEVKKPEGAPEKYDLKLKDNSGLDQSHVDALQSFAKERGLSNDQAQSILDRDAERLAGFVRSQVEAVKAQGQKWVDAVKADAEIGGAYFDQTVAQAVKVVERFGTPELKKILNSSGLGNHPEMIRMISRIAKTMSNDQLVISNMDQTPVPRKSAAEVLYPKS